ncbi:MAG: hypothetical protein Q8R61_14430 [Thiobacillus sp.]|uniref:hypothetical protein n=1 Tax=Thiobacillus sp. TaxID=924 RepID=UPI0027329084|nr:hypothetical protein [Thiobacillus sp.]MDP3422001.1 hypothetical protein [Thiobacillus sp.]MDP3586322.1 hypothetical protein [Thiobacillus sp.]
MSHQCPFPVRSTDPRSSYRAGSVPGLALGLALIAAALAGFGFSAPAGAERLSEQAVAQPYSGGAAALSPSLAPFLRSPSLPA